MILGLGNTIPSDSVRQGIGGGGGGETKFVMEVTIPSDGYAITLFMNTTGGGAGFGNNYNVDWGDGNTDAGNTGNVSHTYDTGTYDIKVDGVWSPHLYTNVALRSVVTKLKNWGKDTTTFTALGETFRQFTNMEYEATDYPTLSLGVVPTADANYTFLNVTTPTFTGILDVSNWDLSGTTGSLISAFSTGFDNASGFTMVGNTINANSANTFVANFADGLADGEGDININNVTFANSVNMTQFFSGAKGLNNVNNWTLNASGTVDMYRTFYKTHMKKGVTTLDLSGWSNTSSIARMHDCFRDVDFFDVGGAQTTGILDITGWDFSSVNSFYFCFYANKFTEIRGLDGLNTVVAANLTGNDPAYMFGICNDLSFDNYDFPATGFFNKLGNCTNFTAMFQQVGYGRAAGTYGKAPNGINGLDSSSATVLNSMFYRAKFDTPIDISSWDLSSLTTMVNIFRETEGTTTFDFSNSGFTTALTSMNSVIRQNADVTTVTFGSGTSSNDFSNVTTWTHVFYLANSLTSIEFPTNTSFASVTSGGMANFLTGGTMTDAQYDNLLVRFEATNSVNPGGAFKVNAYYTAGGAGETARTALIARGWTFTDLGGR